MKSKKKSRGPSALPGNRTKHLEKDPGHLPFKKGRVTPLDIHKSVAASKTHNFVSGVFVAYLGFVEGILSGFTKILAGALPMMTSDIHANLAL